MPVLPACKHSRSRSTKYCATKNVCFFCGEASGNSGIHEAATFQIDKRVRACAVQLKDTELLAKLSTGDMVALEAKYHSKCLVGLYNRARMIKSEGGNIDETNEISAIAFAEVVMHIEEVRQADETGAPVFKLSDLGQLYSSRIEQLGVKLDATVHTTRLKHRLLISFMI